MEKLNNLAPFLNKRDLLKNNIDFRYHNETITEPNKEGGQFFLLPLRPSTA